jgi:hypothetical protein
MLLFDWKKVFDTAEGNIARCNLIMEMLVNQQIPRNKFDPIYKYSHKNFSRFELSSLMGSFCSTILISIQTKNYVYTMR